MAADRRRLRTLSGTRARRGRVVYAEANRGTLVFGGGVDSRPVFRVFGLPVGIRTEVRDFYSGSPRYCQITSGSLQHNIAFTGGFLVRF